ncbi:MAG: DUF4352 domain-containing protein [Microbacteriaceae bacterium]
MKKTLIALLVAGLALTGCSSSPSEEAPAAAKSEEAAATEKEAVEDAGKRDNPYPLGESYTDGDWTVTVNSVDLNATEAIAAENPFNDEPEDGNVYVMVNVTVAYDGDNGDGEMPTAIFEYVTADGNSIDSYSHMAVEPDALDSMATLYQGASTTGNISFSVPGDAAGEGTIAVKAHMMGDKAFFAVQ